ncbi:MAG: hypothetical protein WD076_00200 [Parvularculaceae bacterium]
MAFEGLLSPQGLGEFLARDFFTLQVGVMVLTALAFLCTFVLCLMAFRAAGGAKRARIDAEAHYRAAQDLAVEVRHLTAQIERATGRRMTSVPSTPVRVGASELTDEAEIEIIGSDLRGDDALGGAGRDAADGDLAHEKALDEAKKAATVPAALLGGLLRRR